MEKKVNKYSKLLIIFSAIFPILLLILALLFVINSNIMGGFQKNKPPVEKIYFEKVHFSPDEINIDILNDGPEPVTIAQILINEAYWKFEITPHSTIQPLTKANIKLNYPWETGEVEKITLITGTGVTFHTEVEVALNTPSLDSKTIMLFILLGLFVGVIPVVLGLSWYPFLKRIKGEWYQFLLAITVGLLIFLGIDAFSESVELLSKIPESLNGTIILTTGILIAVFILRTINTKTQIKKKLNRENNNSLTLAYFIAAGIGLHNLGEGLAIGNAYTLGEIALGSILVIGFMIHNITEGVAIIAPIIENKMKWKMVLNNILLLGIVGGAPTIAGTLLGGLAYSPIFALFFFALGTGAILNVAYDIIQFMNRDNLRGLFSIKNGIGFLIGILIMYATGLIVTL